MLSKQQFANSIDRNTVLCLACSSSLPPLKSTSGNLKANSIFITNCCQRPICPSCIASNPRLARYDPCLACLGGVGVVASGSNSAGKGNAQMSPGIGTNFNVNLDGAVRDEDTFVLGDDDDDDQDYDDFERRGSRPESAPPPPYQPKSLSDISLFTDHTDPSVNHKATSNSLAGITPEEHGFPAPGNSETPPVGLESSTTSRTTPYKYYINRRDTLQGIALRFGLDAYEICRINNLPHSVIRATPHLLHTRAFLLLPPTAKPHASLVLSEAEEKGREEKLVRERAEKKLQTLTKEVDWRVAKAYVALADDVNEQESFNVKRKEAGLILPASGSGSGSDKRRVLEVLAVQQYLDDEEWEAEERRAGRGVQVLSFPSKAGEDNQSKKWW